MPKPRDEPEPTMIKVNGKPFVCACGCNVFGRVGVIYTCNACGEKYKEVHRG